MKNLMDDVYSVPCVLLVKRTVRDPVGGYKTTWQDGETFDAAWEFESSSAMTVAEQQGVTRVYNIYVDRSLNLDTHEAFRRTDNGQTYRVTTPGTDRMTPAFSRIPKRIIQVEKWSLPTDEE